MTAVEGQELAAYPGFSVSFAARVKTLNTDYRITDDYFKSMFIPGVVVGARSNGSVVTVPRGHVTTACSLNAR